MIIKSNDIPAQYNIAAAVALWLLLAGIFVLPGTFTTLQTSKVVGQSKQGKVV